MPLSPYISCPCGSGKQFKWCCQPYFGLVEKAILQEEKGQHGAAEQTLGQLVEKHPQVPQSWGYLAEFLLLNGRLLTVCTAWQVKDLSTNTLNDHADKAYDADVIDQLGTIHDGVGPICQSLAEALVRYQPYHGRFVCALKKVRKGEQEWFAKPIIDSYHTVWMEMHEDLLATLAIARASEAGH